ncbi:hypothetical protein PMZ80_001583 [Knufia obscura]|uniref:Uncharacterized protein n=2 Tax=Knufia TaxID=430999 RepID=A0AAN8EX69_9EURO|nr:hypothetical protein PMZ80_001583 [Knufia obscura]KAK5955591.1 hypothetical protein OHC33_003232 [Knufia fluminis]
MATQFNPYYNSNQYKMQDNDAQPVTHYKFGLCAEAEIEGWTNDPASMNDVSGMFDPNYANIANCYNINGFGPVLKCVTHEDIYFLKDNLGLWYIVDAGEGGLIPWAYKEDLTEEDVLQLCSDLVWPRREVMLGKVQHPLSAEHRERMKKALEERAAQR